MINAMGYVWHQELLYLFIDVYYSLHGSSSKHIRGDIPDGGSYHADES